MVFTHGRGFVLRASFGLLIRSLRCHVLVCHAADTASLATRFLFGKLFPVATLVGFGEKRCRKNLPLAVVQPMRLAAFFLLVLAAITGCGSPFGSTSTALKPIASPDGTMNLTPSVNQSKADPTKYLCVAFDIHDATGGLLHNVQSGASDNKNGLSAGSMIQRSSCTAATSVLTRGNSLTMVRLLNSLIRSQRS